jgi:DNA-binding Lrp family transcriptional regulator
MPTIQHFSHGRPRGKITEQKKVQQGTKNMRKRDSIDRNLIALLEEDARISTSEIARRLGVARSTINERMARLEREGVIMGYCAIIRPEEDVQEMRAMVSLRCERIACRAIINELRAFPEIDECVSVTGEDDLMCLVRTPCAEDLDALVDDISQISGVKSVGATIMLASKFTRRGRVTAHPVPLKLAS